MSRSSLPFIADVYGQQIPKDDPFFISWPDFLVELNRRNFTSLELTEEESRWGEAPDEPGDNPIIGDGSRGRSPQPRHFLLRSTLSVRSANVRPEPQIAEAQRREFFAQIHRWLRQNYAVHVFLQQRW